MAAKHRHGRTNVYTAEEREKIFAADAAESERGRVIIAGTMMEKMLEVALRGHFKAASGVDDDFLNPLFSSSQVPPLGSFAIKSSLACACGLIDVKTYEVLELFRKMRNDAAHLEEFALDAEKVKTIEARLSRAERDYVKRLMRRLKTRNLRYRFSAVAHCLYARVLSPATAFEFGADHRAAATTLERLFEIKWDGDKPIRLPYRDRSGRLRWR